MINLLAALAATAAAQATPPAATPVVPAPAERTLSQISGVTINYYDVSGMNLKQLKESIAALRPKDPTGNPIAGGFKWDVQTGVTKTTTGSTCKITGAHVVFDATADLPRLANPQALDAKSLAVWNNYVREMDVDAAKQVGFYADRMGEIEKALIGQNCDAAAPMLNTALDKLKAEEQAWIASQPVAAPAPVAPTPPPKPIERPDTGNGNTRY
jgi:predicted secreted Zn-dependent protease